jgi:hypothetical protein
MSTEQKTPPKKEGGAFSAITTLFAKKNPTTAILSDSPTTAVTPPTSSAITEKEAGQMAKKIKDAGGAGITYSEESAAERLGIGYEDVTWLRKGILDAGKDYIREAGFVRLTAGGLAKLESRIAQQDTLIVLSAHVVNPRLVLARQPGNPETMRVRVADNNAWCRGMVMSGCIKAEIPKFWSCTERPRAKGRI